MKIIESEFCGRFYIYGRPELVLFFNFYFHWSLLFLRNCNGTASFLHNREGATQGGSLSMVSYGIGVLLLIKRLKLARRDVTHVALGMFDNIWLYFNSLK